MMVVMIRMMTIMAIMAALTTTTTTTTVMMETKTAIMMMVMLRMMTIIAIIAELTITTTRPTTRMKMMMEPIAGTFKWSNGVAVEDAMWANGSPPSRSNILHCGALYKASSTARLTRVFCADTELYICSSTNPASGCAGRQLT